MSGCFCELGMTQLVNIVTCNDMVLTNEPLLYSEIHVNEPFATSDRNAVWFSVVDRNVVNQVSQKSMSTKHCGKS